MSDSNISMWSLLLLGEYSKLSMPAKAWMKLFAVDQPVKLPIELKTKVVHLHVSYLLFFRFLDCFVNR